MTGVMIVPPAITLVNWEEFEGANGHANGEKNGKLKNGQLFE